MAPWTPNADQIGPNEQIGRRLFDKPQLVGALDQKPRDRLRLEHFLEKRDGGETSLDRMGQSSVDKGVRNYLAQRAIKAATKFREPRQFNGWRVIHIKFLRKPPHGSPVSVVPSPITAAALDDLDKNIYHSHALPDGRPYYEMAEHLFWLFSEHGRAEQYRQELSWHERWRVVRTWLLGWLRPSALE
jgi:hypothetical protein